MPVSSAPPIERRRTVAAWAALAAVGPLLTWVFVRARDDIELSTALLLFLALVVAVSAIGGPVVAVVAAVGSSLVVNWFLVSPATRSTVSDPENLVALIVFVAVAGTVGTLVNVNARRTAQMRIARAEAEALARSAAELAADPHPLPGLMEHLRTTFGLTGVAIIGPGDGPPLAQAGDLSGSPDLVLPLRRRGRWADHRITLFGRPVTADDQRCCGCSPISSPSRSRSGTLAEDAAEADVLADVDAVRTALAARRVARPPHPAGIDQGDGVRASRHERRLDARSARPRRWRRSTTRPTASTDWSATCSTRVDCRSARSPSSAARPSGREPVRVGGAQLGVAAGEVAVAMPRDLPLVRADPALLERSARQPGRQRSPPQPGGRAGPDRRRGGGRPACTLRVVDRGPGIAADDRPGWSPRSSASATSTRLGRRRDSACRSPTGSSRRWAARWTLDDTPGGGLTVTLVAARAARATGTARQ